MAGPYFVPGVYVEEISKLPASVAPVATAIPAFVGYTEITTHNGNSLVNQPTRISSLVEFESIFGVGPVQTGIEVTLDPNNAPRKVVIDPSHLLYHSLKLFYANGGGDCYIVSTGDYDAAFNDTVLNAGVNALQLVDEPTLILVPDAFKLSGVALGAVQDTMLALCGKMQDRFSILDVQGDGTTISTEASDFRSNFGNQYLKYGAAYYPTLNTQIGYTGEINSAEIDLFDSAGTPTSFAAIGAATSDSILTQFGQIINDLDDLDTLKSQFELAVGAYDAITVVDYATLQTKGRALRDLGKVLYDWGGFSEPTLDALFDATVAPMGSLHTEMANLRQYDLGWPELITAWQDTAFVNTGALDLIDVVTPDFPGYDLDLLLTWNKDPFDLGPIIPVGLPNPSDESVFVLNGVDDFDTLRDNLQLLLDAMETLANSLFDPEAVAITSSVYANVLNAIRAQGYVLPPSGAIAGIYATVDRDRGVWKAPANVSLNMVNGPSVKIKDADQEDLNVHAATGKSINAIRNFTGKGTLVWGARTLAGNDNEWRYVNVRRLYIFVEESVEKATEFVVFEPNDANTWNRLRAMIGNFLTGLWRDGALAGAKPEDAFFVNCGLGVTMTPQDILEGRLIVEIGMAAVRPAEFIILRFSHMLQSA